MTFLDGFMFAAGKAAFGIACALVFIALMIFAFFVQELITDRRRARRRKK